MKSIIINTRKSAAIEEWMMKEEGSWEDHKKSSDHAYSILSRWGGRITLTETEAKTVLTSGMYHSTAWNDDEIDGGENTKRIIKKYCDMIAAKM